MNVVKQLWMSMEIMAPAFDFVMQVGNAVNDGHLILTRGAAKLATTFN